MGSCRGVAKEGGGVPLTVSEIIHLFDTIDVGCPMASVEARLGAPIDVEDEDGDAVAWYVAIPVQPHMSPLSPGAIEVHYKSGLVVAKRLDPQIR